MISRSSSFMSSANVGRGALSLNTNVVMSQGSQVPPVSAAPDGCSAAVGQPPGVVVTATYGARLGGWMSERLSPQEKACGSNPASAEQLADARDDLVTVQLDVGHELFVGQAGHAVLQVEPGGAKGAEVGGDLLRDGFG